MRVRFSDSKFESLAENVSINIPCVMCLLYSTTIFSYLITDMFGEVLLIVEDELLLLLQWPLSDDILVIEWW